VRRGVYRAANKNAITRYDAVGPPQISRFRSQPIRWDSKHHPPWGVWPKSHTPLWWVGAYRDPRPP